MILGKRRSVVTGIAAIGLTVGALAVAPPASALSGEGWVPGKVSFNSKMYCWPH